MREMFKFLFSMKGNDRVCVWSEPLWNIPFNMYMPFMTMYMFSLGVNDIQFGIIISVGLVVQVIFSVLGGVLTDKFGRRLMTFIGDTVAWSIPMLIWAFSQNFWWFLIGSVITGTRSVSMVSWHCLWTDDKKDEIKTQKIINWMHILAQLPIFFVPFAGIFVDRIGVIPAVRLLFIISFISMTIKFVITYIYTNETERGKARMIETKDTSLFKLIKGYKRVWRQILLSPDILRVTLLRALLGIIHTVGGTFFALYATQNLGIAYSYLAFFAILRSGIMLAFFFLIQNQLSVFNSKTMMLLGLAVYIAANGLLIVSPAQNLIWLSVFIIIDTCAVALFQPRLETLAIHVVRPRERARTQGIFDAITFTVAVPFGFLAGFLSDVDRRLPFVLNIILFLLMICFVVPKKKIN